LSCHTSLVLQTNRIILNSLTFRMRCYDLSHYKKSLIAATTSTKKTSQWAYLKPNVPQLQDADHTEEDIDFSLLRADTENMHHLQLLSTLLPAQYAVNFTKCCTC